ncbi:MAG: hypothetical protein R3321_14430 [Nitrososphaeraceae archaeon]|nr:hypothetical protein [Nitrososphaeraceae archaeon]
MSFMKNIKGMLQNTIELQKKIDDLNDDLAAEQKYNKLMTKALETISDLSKDQMIKEIVNEVLNGRNVGEKVQGTPDNTD